MTGKGNSEAMKKHADLSLYLVTDAPEKCRLGLLETVEAAIAGGVTVVQYRSDNPDAGTCYEEAKKLADFLRPRKVPFIVNNRADLALATGADGVHVGQRDLPATVVRRLLGPDKIVGLSVSNRAELEAALAEPVDYLGIGPVFPTVTKKDASPAVGAEDFSHLAARTSLPVVAIGGIDICRAKALRKAVPGVGIAVVSAICGASDPYAAARALAVCE